MDWQVELLFAARVVLATLAGGLIGWEVNPTVVMRASALMLP
ncbi:hypothetical protein [Hyphomicrobium sp.]